MSRGIPQPSGRRATGPGSGGPQRTTARRFPAERGQATRGQVAARGDRESRAPTHHVDCKKGTAHRRRDDYMTKRERCAMESVPHVVERVFLQESGRILGALIAATRDFALAEDALQDACIAALQQWPAEGVPRNPAAWLNSVARRKAIDRLRRDATLVRKQEQIGALAALDRMGEGAPGDLACVPSAAPSRRSTANSPPWASLACMSAPSPAWRSKSMRPCSPSSASISPSNQGAISCIVDRECPTYEGGLLC